MYHLHKIKIHDIILAIQKYSLYLKIFGINPHAVSITIGLFIRSIPILNQRAKNLIMRGSTSVVNESLEDAFLDMSNYGIMATLVKEKIWGK